MPASFKKCRNIVVQEQPLLPTLPTLYKTPLLTPNHISKQREREREREREQETLCGSTDTTKITLEGSGGNFPEGRYLICRWRGGRGPLTLVIL
jgi:hypothetical protein